MPLHDRNVRSEHQTQLKENIADVTADNKAILSARNDTIRMFITTTQQILTLRIGLRGVSAAFVKSKVYA